MVCLDYKLYIVDINHKAAGCHGEPYEMNGFTGHIAGDYTKHHKHEAYDKGDGVSVLIFFAEMPDFCK